MNLPLSGKTIAITGAAGRLGSAFTAAVVEAGGRVVAIELDRPETMARLATAQRTLGAENVMPVGADITDADSLDRCISAAVDRYGAIDALVNNAYPRNSNFGRRFEDVTYTDFTENVGMHTGGYFLASQRFITRFKQQGHGNIVNMSSIYGVAAPRFEIYADTAMTMAVEYAVIKSGIVHLTRYIAAYHKGLNIRCNAISPGGILDGQDPAFLERYASLCSSKGMLSPKDICGTLIFLLSEASSFINGQNVIVDDGWTL